MSVWRDAMLAVEIIRFPRANGRQDESADAVALREIEELMRRLEARTGKTRAQIEDEALESAAKQLGEHHRCKFYSIVERERKK